MNSLVQGLGPLNPAPAVVTHRTMCQTSRNRLLTGRNIRSAADSRPQRLYRAEATNSSCAASCIQYSRCQPPTAYLFQTTSMGTNLKIAEMTRNTWQTKQKKRNKQQPLECFQTRSTCATTRGKTCRVAGARERAHANQRNRSH